MLAETRGINRPASTEERRLWRQLLARLHPDVGGDPELFLFACSVRDQLRKPEPPEIGTVRRGRPTGLFLHPWRDTMGSWASGNRDALNRFRASDGAPYTR